MTWPECIAFRCGTCKGHAIELIDSDPADARECYECNRIPDLAQAPEAEEPAAPPDGGATEAEAGIVPLYGGSLREIAEGTDRSATQRTRPGSPPATQAGSPESRTVAWRDSAEPSGQQE